MQNNIKKQCSVITYNLIYVGLPIFQSDSKFSAKRSIKYIILYSMQERK